MGTMKQKLLAAWAWLRAWGWALLLGLLGLLGAGWAIRRQHERLGEVQDALAVERAQRAIAELRGRRDQLLTEVTADHALVVSLDEDLAANKRKLVEAHVGGAGLTQDEVDDAFQKLGY